MNKNKLGFAWLLLTLIMVGMSLSPVVSNGLSVIETVDSTEIVAEQNDDYESENWAQEEQTKKEVDEDFENNLLLPTETAEDLVKFEYYQQQASEEVEELEIPNDLVEVNEVESRAVDTACIGDFNLDIDGPADAIDRGNGYLEELDLAPEVLEDFQSADDTVAEEGIFDLTDTWFVTDEAHRQGTPSSGQDREVVISGQANYADTATQTAFLTAGDYTLEMLDDYGDGWNGNVFTVRTLGGTTVDSATLNGGGFGTANIDIPADGIYVASIGGGSWKNEVYFELHKPEYPNPNAGGGFQYDPVPFQVTPTGATKAMLAGDYTLEMRDSYGDGWNGATMTITDLTTNQEILSRWTGPSGWWSYQSITLNFPSEGDYQISVGGGSYDGEISVEFTPDFPIAGGPSEYFMHVKASSPSTDGSFMTTTCYNAGDYNQVFASFGYFMDGNFGTTSGLSLEVRAEDDRDADNQFDFYGGSWQEVWEERSNDVDPDGEYDQDFWFTANIDLTQEFCDDVGCAEKLSFRFNFDNGRYSYTDDYAIDNFRIQAYGQFSDVDGDGVPDQIDDCDGFDNANELPNNEQTHAMFPNAQLTDRGCPLDSDGDGVFDLTDWCPSTPSAIAATGFIADGGLMTPQGCEPGIPMSSFTMSLDNRDYTNTMGHVETFNDPDNGDADPMNTNIDYRQGWSSVEDDGLYHWQHYNALNPGTFEGARSLVHAENSNDLVDSAWIISPKIEIPDDSEFGVKMNFAIMNEWSGWGVSGYSHSQGEFAIYASTKSCQPLVADPANGNMIDLKDDTDGDGQGDYLLLVPDNLGFQQWSQHTVDIPERFFGEDVCFAFHNAAPRSGTVFLDFFQFYEQPTPPDLDNDGVWDAYPTSEVDGQPVYGANAGLDIDVCPNTPSGQAVVGMNVGVVNGQEDRPLATQPADVGCSAPISLPYSENFNGILNMPAGIQFGTSDGEGIQSEGSQWETLWSSTGSDGQQGHIRADDFPSSSGVTQYLVMPMVGLDSNLDAAMLTFQEYSPDAYQFDSTSYHGIHVSIPDQTSLDRSCEVGLDSNGDKVADAIAGVNDGWTEVVSLESPTGSWSEVIVDLSDYVGNWVCVAFAFRSEGDQNWYVDTVNIEGVILPPDLMPPTVSEFNPYTGVNTYRADGRLVEITLADSESGIDDGNAPTSTSKAPQLVWALSDGSDAGSIAMDSESCDVSVLPYQDRECTFSAYLPDIPKSGLTMTYSVKFQDIGFKTNNDLIHPTTNQVAGCMDMMDFVDQLDDFNPAIPAELVPSSLDNEVCGGPNEVEVGPYSYTLLNPTTGLEDGTHHQASMMNIGISGLDDLDGNQYDIHMTYFSDVNEYVLEYSGDCAGDSGVRNNNWLDNDAISLSESVYNQDTTTSCGNVLYSFDGNDWIVTKLNSEGIDYNHNGLESQQRGWADKVTFQTDRASWAEAFDMPSALTDVNDIVIGDFGRHTFSEPSLAFDVLEATDGVMGDYLTTSDGMTLYVFWGDTPGSASTCDAQCLQVWPAFYAGENPMFGQGLDPSDFGAIGMQTTYKGYPLYTYTGDIFETDMNGEGLDTGGVWHVATSEYADGPVLGCISSLEGGAPYSTTALLCAGTYTLNMEDSYGDGWNGNTFTMNGNGVSWSATFYGGSSAQDESPELVGDTEVTISVGGGRYMSEVSWELVPASNVFEVSASGSSDVTEDFPAGSYTLNMADSYGDGWNGNQWTLIDNGFLVAGPFTIFTGNTGTATFTLDSECTGCVAEADGGSWISEVSWVLTQDSDEGPVDWSDLATDFPGRLVQENGGSNSDGYGTGEFGIFYFQAGDYSFSMTDSYGDGWNGNGMTLKDSSGIIVAQETLTSGSAGSATFTLEEGYYALDVGVTQPGSWDSEIGWTLTYDDFEPPALHFTQLCITSNGAIAFTNSDDCTSSSNIIDQYGWNGFIYQNSGFTSINQGGLVYVQVQNIQPQEILEFGPESFITTGDGDELDAWEHTVWEDSSDNDGSLTLDLEKMHPNNPGLYYNVISASEEVNLDGCNYDLFFKTVDSGNQEVSFTLIEDATTNAPEDEVDYLQEGGIHQSTDGSCDLTVQLMEESWVHHETKLTMTVQNIPEERPDYSFSGSWDYELVDAVLPGTLVPVTVQVQNNDDGIASQGGAMYDHGHSLEVCFSTNDFDDCYYTAWVVDPPAPGAVMNVEGQFVLDSGTELVTTNLDVHTCDVMTLPGDTDNQAKCNDDLSSAASYNGMTRKGAKVTPYEYAEQSEVLEQTSTDNDMAETDERPIRISYGVANSVPSFAPSLMAIGLVGLFAAALVQGSRSDEEDDEEEELFNDEAAVSPVIATILMVAITVVLSGVIYVWASQLATTSTKVTPLLTFKTEASEDGFWQITVTTAENPLALQAVFVQVEFQDDSCEASYCIITQTLAEPQSYGFTTQNSDSFITYMDMYDCGAGEGTDGCTAEFSAMDLLRINFNHPVYGAIDEGIVQLAYQIGGEVNVLGEWAIDSSTPSIK